MQTAPIAVSQRTAAQSLGLSRKLVAAQVKAGQLRTVPGSSLLLVADLERAYGQGVQARISEHLAGRFGRSRGRHEASA